MKLQLDLVHITHSNYKNVVQLLEQRGGLFF